MRQGARDKKEPFFLSFPRLVPREQTKKEQETWERVVKGMERSLGEERTLTSFSFVEISELEVKGLKFFSFFSRILFWRSHIGSSFPTAKRDPKKEGYRGSSS